MAKLPRHPAPHLTRLAALFTSLLAIRVSLNRQRSFGREDLEQKWESIVESICDRGAQHPARILSQQLGQIDPAIAATHA